MASRGSSTWREDEFGPPCKSAKTLIEDWLPGVNLYVDARCYEAFVALADIIRAHDYPVRSKDTGSYNCRKIKGTNAWSSHAWGIAVDINWQTNPYRRDKLVTDMPRAMVEDIERLKTVGGQQVFRWGGDWDGRPETPHSNYDAMHIEVVATPKELAKGIDYEIQRDGEPVEWPTVEPKPAPQTRSWEETLVKTLPTLSEKRTPQRLDATKRAQALVNVERRSHQQIKEDGFFGQKTTRAVRLFQKNHRLTADGIVGPNTWTELIGG